MTLVSKSLRSSCYGKGRLHRLSDPPAGTAAATLRGVADSDAYVDSRMRVTERLQVTRQPITGDRLTACTATVPPLKPATLREDQLGGLHACQHRPRFGEKECACAGQSDATGRRGKNDFVSCRSSSDAIAALAADRARLSAAAAHVTCRRDDSDEDA
jgi:hypothetical protein